MKKIIFIIVIFFTCLPSISWAQTGNTNLSLFTGAIVSVKNTNNSGYWYGVYADYMPVKTPEGFNLGISFLGAQSKFQNNTETSIYEGKTTQFGLGLNLGKYWEFFSLKNSAYLGGNLSFIKSFDEGRGQNFSGIYQMEQNDLMLSAEVNFTLMKQYGRLPKWFNQSSFKVRLQKPMESQKEDSWNGEAIPESMIWNKSSNTLEVKQNILDIGKFENVMTTKLVLAYYSYQGDKSQWLVFGPELGLKKWEGNDYINLYFLIKKRLVEFEEDYNGLQLMFGINVRI
jgi:hypothetical protein